jgi:uncharacterized delta-60 repeat protein
MRTLLLILVSLLFILPCQADVITVDDNEPADYNSIQDAIDNSTNSDLIEVRRGTYYENINFYGKAIIVTSTDPNDSDVVSNTIIWGNNPAGTVRFETYEDSNSVLTGFTIQSTDTPGQGQGIGVYCYYSSPSVSNCVIRNHATGIFGQSAAPTLVGNKVRSNAGHGVEACNGLIRMCAVGENGGEGIRLCHGEIRNCSVYDNAENGLWVCDASISNCLIYNNDRNGLDSCQSEIVNCTVVNNGDSGLESCGGTIKNCIVISNGRYGFESCLGSILYNDVWNNGYGSYGVGTIPSMSDIHTNPLFADVSNHDYHLKSAAGRWDPNMHTWVDDDINSPSLDTGDPCDPTGDEPYPNGDIINQGAYGGTEQASKSPLGQTVYCDPNIPGDVDENCEVDFRDVAIFGPNWFDVGLEPNIIQEWVARYNGPPGNSEDVAHALAIDSNDNIYVTGYSRRSGIGRDYATIKYRPDSNEPVWVARYNGPGNNEDVAYAIAIDSNDNIYVTGYSQGSATAWDYATIKYRPDSNEPVWVARYNGPGNNEDVAYALAMDSNDNIYVTGKSYGSDPDAYRDYATIKYGPDSNEPVWVARYNGPGSGRDVAYVIAIDSNDNIYVTGHSQGSATAWDYATIKYGPDSNEPIWVARYDGTANEDVAYAIAIDSKDNIYVAGYSYGSGTWRDYATIKYGPDSNEPIWVARYDGTATANEDEARAIAIDANDDIYVTGYSYGSGTWWDYATIKYGPDSNEPVWVARYSGPGGETDVADALAIDSNGNIYVTGTSYGSGTGRDYATIKYGPDSNEPVWVARYSGTANDDDNEAYGIAIDSNNNVYVTGYSESPATGDDYTTVKYARGYTCAIEIPSDYNQDCIVDFADLEIIIDHWLECNLDPPEACFE